MLSFLAQLCGCRCNSPKSSERKIMPEAEVKKTTEAPLSGPPPAGPEQSPGMRSPDERAAGTRKTGTPETDLGAMNRPDEVS